MRSVRPGLRRPENNDLRKGQSVNEKSEQARETSPGGHGPVLVAVDFTPDSRAALVWACGYADSVQVPVKVLHVVHDPEDAPGYYQREEGDQLRPMEDIAMEMMTSFLQQLRTKLPDSASLGQAEPILVVGIPESRILEVAERSGARIIVMGSRGRTGLPHLLLGSKAERVVQRSPIPVTIVKAEVGDD